MLRGPRKSVRVDLGRRVEPVAYERLGDAILVARARGGDARALDALVRRHEPVVHALAARTLRDREDARDAAQEALAKLCTRLDQFRGEAAFSTWLHRLVVNTCRDLAQRQSRRRHEPLEHHDHQLAPGEASRLEAVALRPLLQRPLARLPLAQRRALVLHALLQWPYEDIAGVLDVPVGTVKCHAHRGRQAMRRALSAEARLVS